MERDVLSSDKMYTVFICGSALRGQPDHDNLPDDAFAGVAKTAAKYRLHSVKDGWHPGAISVGRVHLALRRHVLAVLSPYSFTCHVVTP